MDMRHSHSVQLGGQPGIVVPDFGTKHMVYATFYADGKRLPPVIFYNDKKIHTQKYENEAGEAFVKYIPHVKGAGEYSTRVYIESMTSGKKNFFGNSTHLLLDSLHGHFTPEVKTLWNDYSVTIHKLPASTGKYLNPCDNIINREFRRIFNKMHHRNADEKLQNIISAYYAIPRKVILSSFARCGIFEGNPVELINNLDNEGYKIDGHYEDDFLKMKAAYINWTNETFTVDSDSD
eukprot:TRINITY_DN12623_c0_g1_i1.p1 TRINITY_DN12623_c0_g1~~TRINITY_DN12623_c0_g1_i1.p1  ORF type:complete len:235 (+),score=26.22 TRINITY_DN12623_c0_g1_i1:518-1222(+)